jgi:hypothetical protein
MMHVADSTTLKPTPLQYHSRMWHENVKPKVHCTTTVVKVVKRITKTVTKTKTTTHVRTSRIYRPHLASRAPSTPPRENSCSALAAGAPAAELQPEGDAGETTDDGSASPILRIRNSLAGGRDRDVNLSATAATSSSSSSSSSSAAAAAAAADTCDHDVFDSQGRRFHWPAIQGTNILRLVDLPWFREECDHILSLTLGRHNRDTFDLVSKYALALKARCGRVVHHQCHF